MKKMFFVMIVSALLWADGAIISLMYHEIYGADQVALIKVLPDSGLLSIRAQGEPYWYLRFANSMLLPLITLLVFIGFVRMIKRSDFKNKYTG